MSVISASLSKAWTQPASNVPGQINLTDNTIDRTDIPTIEIDGDPPGASQVASVSPRASNNKINRISSVKEEIARRRYSKFSEAKYREAGLAGRPVGHARKASTVRWDVDNERGESDKSTSDRGIAAIIVDKDGKLRRGSRKVRGLENPKISRSQRKGREIAIDVLYENQRGWWFFGLPLYSAASLLNFDPSPWATANGEPSPVDTSNAQLPDPSWEWGWKTWYVDMSQDVDEQGWQYSFMFQRPFAWHGTHPWPYSFVRRRRWIRKRVKKHKNVSDDRQNARSDTRQGLRLTPEYFTIHSTMSRSTASSYAGSVVDTINSSIHSPTTTENTDIETIPALIKRLKIATIDREKINAIVQYMDQAGEDSYYLANEMEHITSLFLFQHSRRHLPRNMIKKLDQMEQHEEQDAHPSPSDKDARLKPESAKKSFGATLMPSISKASTEVDGPQERLQRKIENLRRAVHAADKQVKQLEYWSDIKDMVRQGETAGGADPAEGWDEGWQGIDASGPSSDKVKGKARATDIDPGHDPLSEPGN